MVYPHEEDGEREGSGHSVTSFAAVLQELEKGGPPLIADPPPLQKNNIMNAQDFSFENKTAKTTKTKTDQQPNPFKR